MFSRKVRIFGRSIPLAVILAAVLAVGALAGWLSVVATFTGTISTGQGLSGNFTGVGSCSILSGPGSVAFVSASGSNMTFTGSGWTPSTVARCEAVWRNTSNVTVYAPTAPTSSQTWATLSNHDNSNWSNAEEKPQRVTISLTDALPEGASGLPLVITFNYVPAP